MRKRFSVFHFLIIIMMFSIVLPANVVDAGWKGPGKGSGKGSGSLTIHKYEVEQGFSGGEPGDGTSGQKSRVPGDATLLPGVKFKITQTHTFNPATGEFSAINRGGYQGTQVTNSNGQAHFGSLSLGRYKVEEVSGPPHVILNKDPYYVDIPMTSKDGTSTNSDVHIYPKNEVIHGAVELKKIDGKSKKPKNPKTLPGVKFELYDASTNTKIEHEGAFQFQTNSDGKIQIDGLPFGSYYFKEVSTLDGYLLGDQRVEFTISKSGSFNPNKGKIEKITVENYKKPEISKKVDKPIVERGNTVTYTLTVDLPGDIKNYKSFVITDELDPNLEFVSQSSPRGFTFNRSGQTLTWTANPTDIRRSGQVQITFKAKVSKDAEVEIINNKGHINYENKHSTTGEEDSNNVKIEVVSGSIKIIKVDGNNTSKKLKGAQFKLTSDQAGNNVIDATGKGIKVNGALHSSKLENLTTDNNGEITIEGLSKGTYYIHETKAPTYNKGGQERPYNLRTQPVTVDLQKGESKTVTIKNYKSGWELPKTGGAGTLLFTFIGLSLMGLAIFMIIRRRRSDIV